MPTIGSNEFERQTGIPNKEVVKKIKKFAKIAYAKKIGIEPLSFNRFGDSYLVDEDAFKDALEKEREYQTASRKKASRKRKGKRPPRKKNKGD